MSSRYKFNLYNIKYTIKQNCLNLFGRTAERAEIRSVFKRKAS